ncbi:MAG: chromosomal replication initiator protein DnaA [Coriobacteriia bacterium]|nr:chromosomal replication initiator protein DnaA [Coriobacteriia bacterium]
MNLEEARENLIEKLKSYCVENNTSESQVTAFFNRMEIQAMADGFAMLTFENEFIKNWIETHYISDIKRALNELYGGDWMLQFEVDNTSMSANAEKKEKPTQNAAPETERQQETQETPKTEDKTATENQSNKQEGITPKAPTEAKAESTSSHNDEPAVPESESRKLTSRRGANGETKLTFDNFVTGASNRMAYSMAIEVADKPSNSALNPLFIYGRSGVGKTHLLCAITNYIKEQYPTLKVRYIDAMEMVNEYGNAAINKSFQSFEDSFRELDVLLIDDIQALRGKQQTLDILFRIFNELIPKGKQFVFSADRAPKNIDLDERYVSRFNSGATIDVHPPDAETKRNIAKSFLLECQEEEDFKLELPDDVLDYIAENSSSNVRELKSAVTNVVFALKIDPQHTITKQQVKQMLSNHFASDTSNKVTMDIIKDAVCSFYDVSEKELTGPGRSKKIKNPRNVAIYLSREMIDSTFAAIGDAFNRSHSTIMHSYEVFQKQVNEDRSLHEEVEAIREKIRVQ